MTQPKHVMPVGMAAQLIGCTPGYLHSLDEALCPVRDRYGRRWYDPADVARVAEERAARRLGTAPIAPLQTRGGR